MSLFARYIAHLKRRATGLTRWQWYSVSSIKGLPWVLAALALGIPASLLPDPQRAISLWLVAVATLPGFIASQLVMLVVHLNEVRRQTERLD